ncbi:GntR family transcriptional regulator [Candidimonas nitroreducens]|uniref:HTH gntR-type domain-containing protein n=1 Tax=Candidimonas nitroreducens TaxID=683354 RepID=A0A225MZ39_9BURK|nr:GntR family transcriptional regulator [Candidimonas nitroreducens]OWT65793.1 hypothetical protein CEY11_03430 [Candidimonas nitroreducens]
MSPESALPASPTPLYFRVEQRIRQSIDDGLIAPGAELPTEVELCKRYGVSRITVRRALGRLVSQGVVVRKQGVGTFVSHAPSKLVQLTASLETMLAPAPSLSQVVLGMEIVKATGEIAAGLRLAEDEPVMACNMLHCGREGPFSFSFMYVTPDVGRQLDPKRLVEGRPAVCVAEDVFNRQIGRAEQAIDPDRASRAVASHLEIKAGTPLLRVTRTYFVDSDQPIATVVAWYHPQRFRYSVLLLPSP